MRTSEMIGDQRIILELPNTIGVHLKTSEGVAEHREQKIDQQETSHRHVNEHKNFENITTELVILFNERNQSIKREREERH